METFFNQFWADRIQKVSLFLELLGFCMAWLELKNPDITDRIERSIDTIGGMRVKIGPGLDWTITEWDDSQFNISCGVIVSVFAIVLIVGGFFLIKFFGSEILRYSNEHPFKFLLLLIAIGIPGLAYILIATTYLTMYFFAVLSKIIERLNSFSNGKAFGTLGLIIAFVGLLGEIYQVITILQHCCPVECISDRTRGKKCPFPPGPI